jgi:WD40 repeat protein
MGYAVFEQFIAPIPAMADGEVPDVFTCSFSQDSQHITVGCSNGTIHTLAAASGRSMYLIHPTAAAGAFPVTCVRYRPTLADETTRNVLLATTSSGFVQHWHVSSGKAIHTISEQPNQTYCCDYRRDGAVFATAGQDFHIRIYDEATKTLASTLYGGTAEVTAGHSNRVFALKWHPTDRNVLLTSGWDNTLCFWDVRAGHAVRSIYGANVCGNGIDIHGDKVLTGSWRTEQQLQLWSYGDGRLLETIPLGSSSLRPEPLMLYSAQFSPNGRLIACCGSGANEAKVVDADNGQVLMSVSGGENGFYDTEFSPDGQRVAFAGHGGKVYMYEVRSQ